MLWVHHKRILKPVALVAAMGWGVLSGGCREKPVEPKPEPEPKDYRVYYADMQTTPARLRAIHPTTCKIDSVLITWKELLTVAVSADGHRLYLSGGGDLSIVDSDSGQLINTLPLNPKYYFRTVATSPDGLYLGVTGDSICILRTSDYSTVYADTVDARVCTFSSDSRSFFFSTAGTPDGSTISQVGLVHFLDSAPHVIRKSIAGGSVKDVVPSIDQSKWYLYLRLFPVYTWAFVVWDVTGDSVYFAETLVPGAGSLAASPDGKSVYYTNPGGSSTDPPTAWLNFKRYDVAHNTADFVLDSVQTSRFPNTMAITPDSRYVVIFAGFMHAYKPYLFDVDSGRIIFDWTGKAQLTDPGVQLMP